MRPCLLGINATTLLATLFVVGRFANADPSGTPPGTFTRAPILDQKLWRQYLDVKSQQVVGRVLGPDGKPVAKARVFVHAGFTSRPVGETQTDNEGRFQIEAADSVFLFAFSADGGLESDSHFPMSYSRKKRSAFHAPPEIELTLKEPPRRLLPIQVTDNTGAAVSGATAIFQNAQGLDQVAMTDEKGMLSVPMRLDSPEWEVLAFKPGVGLGRVYFGIQELRRNFGRWQKYSIETVEPQLNDWLAKEQNPVVLELTEPHPVKLRVVDQRKRPVSGLLVCPSILTMGNDIVPETSRITDENGQVHFDFLPIHSECRFSVAKQWHRADSRRFYLLEPSTRELSTGFKLSKGLDEVTLRVAELEPIRGRVVDSNRNPVPEVGIHASAKSTGGTAVSKQDGTFEVYVEPGNSYTLTASSRIGESLPYENVRVDFDTPVDGVNLVLQPRAEVTIFGAEKVVDPGHEIGRLECTMKECPGIPLRPFDPKDTQAQWHVRPFAAMNIGCTPSPDGTLKYPLGAGTYFFFGRPWQEPVWFRITDSQPRRIRLKNPPSFPGESTLTGKVFAANGAPTPGIDVVVYPLGHPTSSSIWYRTQADGSFSIRRPKVESIVVARMPRACEAVARISAEAAHVDLKQQEGATIRGRLVGMPPQIPNHHWRARLAFPVRNAGDQLGPPDFDSTIQNDGRFSFKNVYAGLELELQVSNNRRIWYTVGKVLPRIGGEQDVGAVPVTASKALEAMKDPLRLAFAPERKSFSNYLGDAKRSGKRLLLIAGDPEGPLCRDFGRWLKEDPTITADYQLAAQQVSLPYDSDAQAFLPWLDVEVSDAKRMVIAILESDGRLRNRWKPEEFSQGENLDREKVRELLTSHRE